MFLAGGIFTNFIMSTTIYTISNKTDGLVNGHEIIKPAKYNTDINYNCTFIIPLKDIIDTEKYPDARIEGEIGSSNASIILTAAYSDADKQIRLQTGPYVSVAGAGEDFIHEAFEANIKYTLKYTEDGEEITRVNYSKVSFYLEVNDTISSCVMTAQNGTLDPADYIAAHQNIDGGKDDLDSLVTKKGLIANMKEMARQISNKIGATSALSINYNLNGGHWDNGFEPRSTFVVSTGYTPRPPKKVGYKFTGWKVFEANSIDGISESSTPLYQGDVAIKVGTNKDITACAQWAPVNYKVQFNNFTETPSASCTLSIAYGQNKTAENSEGYQIPSGITAGYKFSNKYKAIGLNSQEVIYNIGDSLDKIYSLIKTDSEVDDTTIILNPIEEPKVFNITYDLYGSSDVKPNNGNAKLDDLASNTYTYGTTFNLPIPVAPGFSFTGWTFNGITGKTNERIINPTDLATAANTNITFIATWEKKNYHFEYDLNGGILPDKDNIYIVPGQTYTLAVPEREGYNFKNWTTKTPNKVSISGNKITTNADLDTDVILIANWTAKQVPVTIEYWYENINSTRLNTDATLDNTVYNISKTERLDFDATKTNEQSAISDSELTITSPTSSQPKIVIAGSTGANVSSTMEIAVPTGFTYVTSFISDSKVKANGTTVIRLYFARKAAYYKVIDKYSKGIYEGSQPVDSTNERTAVQCLYGQTVTVSPSFGTDNPKEGYTVDKPSITGVITGTSSEPTTFTFNYTRKLFTVKFDTNDCCTLDGHVGNTYSTTAYYNEKITLPTVLNNVGVLSSKWSKNGVDALENTSEQTEATRTITEETIFVRIPTDINYTLNITCSSGNFKYNNGEEVNTLNISDLTRNNFPYFLYKIESTGNDFVEWQIKMADGFESIPSHTISKDVFERCAKENIGSNGTSQKIYAKAIFSIAEPKILEVGSNCVTGSNNNTKSLRIKKVSAKENINTHIQVSEDTTHISLIKLGSESGIGTPIAINANSTSINIDSSLVVNSTKILLTPIKGTGDNQVTGKPCILTIANNGNTITVTAESAYGASTGDTDTKPESEKYITNKERTKLAGIADNASKVSVTSIQTAINGHNEDADYVPAENNVNKTINSYKIGDISIIQAGDDANKAPIALYGKDTTYGQASNDSLGLVKPGSAAIITPDSGTDKRDYPVQLTSDGEMYVNVPWTDNQNLPKTKIVATGEGDSYNATENSNNDSGTVLLRPVDETVSRNTDGSSSTSYEAHNGIKLTGASGISVKSDNNGLVTISGHDDPKTLGDSGDNAPAAESKCYIKAPAKNANSEAYLKKDGSWTVPPDTQIKITPSANVRTATTPFDDSTGNYGLSTKQISSPSDPITDIRPGNNIKLVIDGSKLIIEGEGDTTYGVESNGGLELVGNNKFKLKNASDSECGGIRVGISGESQKIKGTGINIHRTTLGTGLGNGTYYPVEITDDGAAIVCIPNTNSVPLDGTPGQFLKKSDSGQEFVNIREVPNPAGHTNKFLKVLNSDNEYGWASINEVPSCGANPEGYVLAVKTGGTYGWANISDSVENIASGVITERLSGYIPYPTGGSDSLPINTGKVLKVNSDGSGVEWGDAPSSGAAKWDNTGANKITCTLSSTGTFTLTFPNSIIHATVIASKANNTGTVVKRLISHKVELSGTDGIYASNVTETYFTIDMLDDESNVHHIIAKWWKNIDDDTFFRIYE